MSRAMLKSSEVLSRCKSTEEELCWVLFHFAGECSFQATVSSAQPRNDSVAFLQQQRDCQFSKTARCAGDENELFHELTVPPIQFVAKYSEPQDARATRASPLWRRAN